LLQALIIHVSETTSKSIIANMITAHSSLKVSRDDMAHRLQPLSDDVNDSTAKTVVWMAAQDVSTDPRRLRALVKAIYNKVTTRNDCAATVSQAPRDASTPCL
jgi:hypothetical protein